MVASSPLSCSKPVVAYEVFKHLATRLSVFLFLGIQLDDPLFEEVSQLITTHWRGDWDGKCVRQWRGAVGVLWSGLCG